jgi:hypothetical protein
MRGFLCIARIPVAFYLIFYSEYSLRGFKHKRWIRLAFKFMSCLEFLRFQIVFFCRFRFRTKPVICYIRWCISIRNFCFKSDYTDVTVLKVQFNNSCLNFFGFTFGANFLSDDFIGKHKVLIYTKTAKKIGFVSHNFSIRVDFGVVFFVCV